MGAKQLNPVAIMCELTQSQIEHLVDFVANSLPIRLDELEDIDELMLADTVRLCIDFEVDGCNNISIAEAEILDRDWDVMHTDSFALMHYLQPIVENFNHYRRDAIKQSKAIQNDTRRYLYE